MANQADPRRDPNTMDVGRGREEDRIYYLCGKWGHMARNYWKRKKTKVVEML